MAYGSVLNQSFLKPFKLVGATDFPLLRVLTAFGSTIRLLALAIGAFLSDALVEALEILAELLCQEGSFVSLQ